MSDPHEDDYCIVCGRGATTPGPKMHPLASIENACVCGDCTTPGDRTRTSTSTLLELASDWREAGRGGTSKSGRTAFLTCADELETLLEEDTNE